MNSILVVDDEKNMLTSLEAILSDEGYEVGRALSAEQGIALFRQRPFDLLITDLKMSGMSGLELLAEVRKMSPATPVILITAYATPKSAVAAIKAGAFDYIPKPFDPEEILFSVRRALEFISIQKENLDLRETLESRQVLADIIGEDTAMAAVRSLIETVAPTQATVLIRGESGTGKELVAKAVHELSAQRQKAFVPVNCAAIPEALLESELFGHEKGAFTGALQTKKGKFEIAEGGTIYLDEVADMSLALQAKILRVLEDGRFERVGGTVTIHSSARILAATNKDLKQAIGDGTFREDLFFRLNVVDIELPPLRERVSDIPRLVNHFIRSFNIQYQKNILGISPEALKVMSAYFWPGNVRELKHVIERAVLLEKARSIGLKSLPAALTEPRNFPEERASLDGRIDFKTAVENYEKELIHWALNKNQNRISSSAKDLGLTRHSIRHYLLKYFPDKRELNAE